MFADTAEHRVRYRSKYLDAAPDDNAYASIPLGGPDPVSGHRARDHRHCARNPCHVIEYGDATITSTQSTGIGPPADIDRLQARITELEQQNVDLRLQLEEKDEELSAARAANRELTKTINQGCS
ncbi:hypothetical protein [Streptomyces massasporeus]|uniref:hypothetical protein n=1 Tax=Streptomyces massasporeus TaxID=67324 RepID=UPI0016728190|nr:hypothetical protein [Streptomyces massasporeus]GGV83071.1 hypothetical protein GCM10010228_58800 [Streptomyces massasporeus]